MFKFQRPLTKEEKTFLPLRFSFLFVATGIILSVLEGIWTFGLELGFIGNWILLFHWGIPTVIAYFTAEIMASRDPSSVEVLKKEKFSELKKLGLAVVIWIIVLPIIFFALWGDKIELIMESSPKL